MSALIESTFDGGVTDGLVLLITDYLAGLGMEKTPSVVPQADRNPQSLPLVVVSVTELEEVVYQTGNYRCAIEIGLRVDMDSGSPEQLQTLTGAVLDFLQQVDLIAQFNALTDSTGRPLGYIKLIVLNQTRTEDIGDREWRRVFSVDVFGCAIS